MVNSAELNLGARTGVVWEAKVRSWTSVAYEEEQNDAGHASEGSRSAAVGPSGAGRERNGATVVRGVWEGPGDTRGCMGGYGQAGDRLSECIVCRGCIPRCMACIWGPNEAVEWSAGVRWREK